MLQLIYFCRYLLLVVLSTSLISENRHCSQLQKLVKITSTLTLKFNRAEDNSSSNTALLTNKCECHIPYNVYNRATNILSAFFFTFLTRHNPKSLPLPLKENKMSLRFTVLFFSFVKPLIP